MKPRRVKKHRTCVSRRNEQRYLSAAQNDPFGAIDRKLVDDPQTLRSRLISDHAFDQFVIDHRVHDVAVILFRNDRFDAEFVTQSGL